MKRVIIIILIILAIVATLSPLVWILVYYISWIICNQPTNSFICSRICMRIITDLFAIYMLIVLIAGCIIDNRKDKPRPLIQEFDEEEKKKKERRLKIFKYIYMLLIMTLFSTLLTSAISYGLNNDDQSVYSYSDLATYSQNSENKGKAISNWNSVDLSKYKVVMLIIIFGMMIALLSYLIYSNYKKGKNIEMKKEVVSISIVSMISFSVSIPLAYLDVFLYNFDSTIFSNNKEYKLFSFQAISILYSFLIFTGILLLGTTLYYFITRKLYKKI